MPTDLYELDLAADTLRQNLEAGDIPPHQVAVAEQTMAEYHDRVHREGREPYSVLLQQRSEDIRRVRGYFKQKPELNPDEEVELDELTRNSPNPESDKRQMFNVAFFAHRYGKSADELNLEYPLYKADYAYSRMGRETATDDEVYQYIGAEFQSLDDATNAGATSAIEGRGKGIGLDQLSAWEAQHKTKPGYSEESRKAFIDAYLTTKEALAPHRAEIQSLASAEAPFNDSDVEAWIDRLVDLPPRERTLVTLAAVHSAKLRGEQEKGRKGWFTQAGSALGRFVTADTTLQESGIESVPDDIHTPVSTTVPSIRTQADAAKFFKEQSGRNKAQTFAALSSSGTAAVGHFPIIGGVERKLSPDEAELVKKYKERERQKVNVARQVRHMAHMASPNDSVTASTFGTSLGIMGVMIATRGAATPIVVQHYAANNYEQLRLEYEDMRPSDARAIALAAGALEVIPDMVGVKVLSAMPSVQQLIKGGLKRELIGRAMARTGGAFVYENIQEGMQDLTLPTTHALFAALQKDNRIPGVDWDHEKKRFWETRGDVAIGILPLLLLGTGVASVRDIRASHAMLADNVSLGAAGYLEADRIKVIGLASQGKVAESQAALREAHARRSPEVAAEFEGQYRTRRNESEQAHREAERLGLMPKFTNDGSGYTISYKDGTTARAADWEEARQHAEEHLTDTELEVAGSVARMGEHFMAQKRAGTPEAFTTAVGEGRALQEDVADEVVTEEQAAEAAVVAGQLRGMTREESLATTWQVLGTNRTERRNHVRTLVSTVHRGGNVLTAVEEPIEGRWKAGLDSGHYTREQGLLWVRLAEKATGQSFLSDADAEVLGSADKAPRSLIEAISAIVTADVLGRRKDGTRLPAGLVTQGVMAAVRQAAGAKERGEVVRFGQFLRAWRTLFGQVFSPARALNKARAEGRLGEDYEAFLDELMGPGVEGTTTSSQAVDSLSDSSPITGAISLNEQLQAAEAARDETAESSSADFVSFSIVPNESLDIRIAKAVAAPALEVTDVADWSGITPRERRDKMKAALQDARAKGPIMNAERGREIHVSKSGLEHWNRYAADPRKASLMGHLRELFEQAIYVRSEKPDSRKSSAPGLQLFHKLAVPVRFEGQETMVRLTVHEDANGRWVYDGQVLDVALPATETNTPADGPEGVSRHGSVEEAEQRGIQQVREKILREALKVNTDLVDETATFSMLPSSPAVPGETGLQQNLESQPTVVGTNIDSSIPIPYVQQHGQGTERRRDAQAALRALLPRAEADAGANARADAAERIRAESESLVSWARESGWLIEPAGFARLTPSLKEFEGGAEHQVFGVLKAGRVMKITRPPNFGARGVLPNYLKNIQWSNALFHDDIRIEGVIETKNGPAMVVSQPFISGRSPSVEEVAEWFEKQGYMPAGENRWKHPDSGASIADAHVRNFIMTDAKELVPVDLQVLNPGKEILEQEKREQH